MGVARERRALDEGMQWSFGAPKQVKSRLKNV